MRIRPLLALATLPLAPLAAAWACNDVSAVNAKYNLEPLGSRREASRETDSPPTKNEIRATLDICGLLGKKDGVADEDQVSSCMLRAAQFACGARAWATVPIPAPLAPPPCEATEHSLTLVLAQCPENTRVCLTLHNHKESAGDKDRVTGVIPLWTDQTLDSDIRTYPLGNGGQGGVVIKVKAPDYAK